MKSIKYYKPNSLGIAYFQLGDLRAYIRTESNSENYQKRFRAYDAARNLEQLKNMVEVIFKDGYTPMIFDLGKDVPLRYEIHVPKNSPF